MDVERARTVKGWLPRRLGKQHFHGFFFFFFSNFVCFSKSLYFNLVNRPFFIVGQKKRANIIKVWPIGRILKIIFDLPKFCLLSKKSARKQNFVKSECEEDHSNDLTENFVCANFFYLLNHWFQFSKLEKLLH